ncbi:hypothetical protein BTUL_0268g00030 [Botrytis tulipae]|uniref:Uncharacterized protein n=1 Tax=Botrytis tulipae TaxID=87230 RepID=A0A4Z1EAB7_9HELO|nr:hypothetical protein BTUL_0268g00030 [Botrytis tulipae]
MSDNCARADCSSTLGRGCDTVDLVETGLAFVNDVLDGGDVVVLGQRKNGRLDLGNWRCRYGSGAGECKKAGEQHGAKSTELVRQVKVKMKL